MGIKVKTSRIYWHEADLVSPSKDGEYLAVSPGGTVFGNVGYTKEKGWNSYVGSDGEVVGGGMLIELWADPLTIEEVEI